MPLFTKPQFNSVWAATGSKLTPDNTKISQGWVVEIPPHEYENWVQSRQDQLLAHVNQVGIPMWDATVEYQAGKSYIQGTTSGTVYRAVTTNTNVNPELDIQGNWTVAFEASGEALLKSQNLADVPDKALARQNLGIATTEFYDTRYLAKSNNLADVPNKSSARNVLEVYSRAEVEALISQLRPTGQIAYFATPSAPEGWLVADGSVVSRATYPRLFSVIGTMYGAGNGSTTFRLPDLRGEFIRSFDLGRGVDPGRSFASVQGSQNLSHNHPVNDPGHEHGQGSLIGDLVPYRAEVEEGRGTPDWNLRPLSRSTTNISLGYTGGSESRPRNIALLACIRT